MVGGQKGKGRVSVVLTNGTQQAVAGRAAVGLFLSADDTLDAGDLALAPAAAKKVRLKAGRSTTMRISPRKFPSVSADGTYHLLAEITSPGGGTQVAEAQPTLAMAAPFVDLTGAFPRPLAGTFAAGQKVKTSLVLTNAGNVTLTGRTTVNVFLSADEQGTPGNRALVSPAVKLKVAAGKSKKLNLTFQLPADLLAGTYDLMAVLDPNGTIAESNEANNTIQGGTFSAG